MSSTQTLPLDSEQFATLRRGESILLQLGETQLTLTPPPSSEVIPFAGVSALAGVVMQEVKVKLELLPGKLVEFTIVPLSADQSKACDEMLTSVKPPKKSASRPQSPRMNTTSVMEDYDWDDVAFNQRRVEATQMQQCYMLINGVRGFDVPGASLQEKTAWLRSHFQPRVLAALQSAITKITADPVVEADFS